MGLSDGAADPLADIRARHQPCPYGRKIERGQPLWCVMHGQEGVHCRCNLVGCDMFRVLAALDAERAETKRLRVENEQRRQAQLVLEIARNEAQAAIDAALKIHQAYSREDVAARWPEWLHIYDSGERKT